ncbi:aspartyl aminopeptidase [Fistulifera solaris]|uniref:aspartyl aminopeptidase n=1 Tax=Fistulifera solaris TaxID=1519565 RepID=A0A1Z5KL05_FISSO|nr:aspartyl aminopeptidase [Fistulifera solaris]|eukprot:GAX26815.1 aspartyl aminopeptidase [Fistulifera solaris]
MKFPAVFTLFIGCAVWQKYAQALAAHPFTTTTTKTAEHLPLAQQAMEYINQSTDPFHAVQTSIRTLQQAGFVELEETAAPMLKIQPGGKYYMTRNRSTLVAFAVGQQYHAQAGFQIIGGHTDSPNLRVKARSKRTANGCIQLGVECYGGGLWHTWFDRDLGLSGRVLVRQSDDSIAQQLVQIDRALLRISNLAIHLQTAKEREAFAFNKEDHLSPILAMEVKKALTGTTEKTQEEEEEDNHKKDGWTEHQEPALLQILAHELQVETSQIVDFELCLFDTQKAALGGAYSEFLHGGRLDNLASCFMAVQALVNHVQGKKLDEASGIAMIVLYDHEEVGSGSAVGAASPIMTETIRRITTALNDQRQDLELYNQVISRSFCLSADQAHAIHPNYAGKHEKLHQPAMNAGMVIKRNTNQRYATTVLTGVLMREVARRAQLPPLQEFMIRQDCGCGSTIGPLISERTGMRTIDMGCPQLSMHSIRETMGVCDLTNGLNLFQAFFEHFPQVDASVGK